ncbi:dual specificity protein kinase splA, partial [Exaiptasia diaphana]|uniref:SCA7 domain-containing protein n=1 Tax=Exaiptasia diaphana TaxID=2652724 RepID=A0A913YTH3_EXADI
LIYVNFCCFVDLLHKKPIPPPTPSPDVSSPAPVELVIDQSSNIKIEQLQIEDSTVKIEEVPLTVPKVNHVPKVLPNSTKKSSGSNKKSPRKVIPTREREFDADKHCGVWVQEQQKRCTRSLTCKTHALSLRRAVPGRRKKFDELLAEHKARVNNEKEQQQQNLAAMKLLEAKSTNNVFKKVKTEPMAKPANDKLQNNTHVTSSKEETTETSSKEAENEEVDDSHLLSELSTVNHHPKPLASCSFGGRKVGHGALVFNRRQDHLRCAMLAMVERYLNPQRKASSGRPGAAAILHRPAIKTIGQSSNHSLAKGSLIIGDKNKSHSTTHRNLSNFLKAPPPPRNRSVKHNNVLHGTKHSLENSYQTVLHSKPLIEASEGFDASSQAISDMGNIIASIDSSSRTTIENDTRTIYTSVTNTQSDIVHGQTTMVAKMNGTASSTSTNTVVQIAGQLDPSTGKVTPTTTGQRESPLFFTTQNPQASPLPNGTGPSPPPIASTSVKGYPALSFVIQGSKPANPSPVNFSKGHSLVFNSMGMAQMQQPTSPLQQQQQQQLQQKGKVLLRANSYPKTSGKANNSQVKIPQSPSPQQQLSPGQPKTIIVTSPPPGQQNLYLNHMNNAPIVQLKQQVEQQQQQLQQITLQKQLHQQQLQQQQLQQKQLNSQFAKQLPIQPRLAPAPHPPSQSLLTQQQLAGQSIVIKATDQQMKSPQNTVFVTADSHQTMVKPQSNVA